MALTVGGVFAGRFRLIARIGAGGFGEVFAAEDRNGRRVALKVLHADLVAHPRLRERFEQESRVACTVASPNVVGFIEAGVDDPSGTPWIAYELLDGETLAERIQRERVLPVSLVQNLFEQLGEGIAAAHGVGVIHADLKPENIFLVGQAHQPTVKVLDFGISKMLRAGKLSTKVTTAIGSPQWTAPEQFETGASLRASTDVWPLGLIAFRLLTGKHFLRYADEDVAPVPCVAEICLNPLASASERAREMGVDAMLPRDFDLWFRHCVVREPAERFQHGRAAVTALLTMLRPAAAPVRRIPRTVDILARERGTVALPLKALSAVQAMLERGDYAQARHKLEAVLKEDGGSAATWALTGECDLYLGRYEDAVAAWSEAIVQSPSVGAYVYGRSLASEALGQRAAARADRALAEALGYRESAEG